MALFSKASKPKVQKTNEEILREIKISLKKDFKVFDVSNIYPDTFFLIKTLDHKNNKRLLILLTADVEEKKMTLELTEDTSSWADAHVFFNDAQTGLKGLYLTIDDLIHRNR